MADDQALQLLEKTLRASQEAGAKIPLRKGRGVSEGSPGTTDAVLYSTIDDDTREAANARLYPFRAVFRVVSRFAQPEQGTAFLVSENTLLTAGHCIFQAESGERATALQVFDGVGKKHDVEVSTALRAWEVSRVDSADLGFIKLKQPIGERLGFFGTRSVTNAQTIGSYAVSGYPVDLDNGLRQHFGVGKIVHRDPEFLQYDIDTESGQSGAPLFYTAGGVATAVGVHIQGVTTGRRANLALRLTPSLIKLVKQWGK